jgi:hypothetical protein
VPIDFLAAIGVRVHNSFALTAIYFPYRGGTPMRYLWDRPALVVALLSLAAGLALSVSRAPAAGDEDKKVEEGQPAPDVELPATQIDKVHPDQKDAKMLHLKDLQDKKNVVLYFFPKALTGG